MTEKHRWLKKPSIKTEDLLKLYESGLSGTQIGEKLGIAKSTVTRRLKKAGFNLKDSSSYSGKARYWLWKGEDYIDPIIRKYNQRRLRKWSEQVRTRDNHTCRDCGTNGVLLHSHHIVPIEDCINLPIEFDPENGITLCVKCHKARHKELRDR